MRNTLRSAGNFQVGRDVTIIVVVRVIIRFPLSGHIIVSFLVRQAFVGVERRQIITSMDRGWQGYKGQILPHIASFRDRDGWHRRGDWLCPLPLGGALLMVSGQETSQNNLTTGNSVIGQIIGKCMRKSLKELDAKKLVFGKNKSLQ